jgi:hypothetical protein
MIEAPLLGVPINLIGRDPCAQHELVRIKEHVEHLEVVSGESTAKLVPRVDSTGRCNTSIVEVSNGQASGLDEGVDGSVGDEVAGSAVASQGGRARVLA